MNDATEEKNLIDQIRNGDRDSYAQLVRSHRSYLFQLCLAFLSDRHEAEEAAQVVFIKAYQALSRFHGGSSFRTWLTRIGINHCKDQLKKRRRSRTVPLDDVLAAPAKVPETLIERPQEPAADAQLPPGALKRLSPGEREAFRLAADDPKAGYEAMGKKLGISRDSVKGRLKRAREKIQSYLKRFGV